MTSITSENALIAEVAGGVDTHQDTHTAAVIDLVGRVLGTEQDHESHIIWVVLEPQVGHRIRALSRGRSGVVIDDYLGHWWVLALRGVLALIFGIMAVAWPGITLVVLALVFGAYAIVDGALAAVAATRAAKGQRAPLILLAVAGLLFGIMCVVWPGLTVLVIALLIGIWAIVTGVMEIMTAIRMRKEIQGEWLHIVVGALSVLFGVLVLAWPATGALTIALIIGIYAILAGIMLIVLSLRVRRMRESVP